MYIYIEIYIHNIYLYIYINIHKAHSVVKICALESLKTCNIYFFYYYYSIPFRLIFIFSLLARCVFFIGGGASHLQSERTLCRPPPVCSRREQYSDRTKRRTMEFCKQKGGIARTPTLGEHGRPVAGVSREIA